MSSFHLKHINIKNFRSIKNISLEIKDGLYAIIGKNSDQPSTFNGAGKSSLVYSIWWCLTGSSLGGEVLADDVVNIQEGKDCCVECIFDTDQGEIIITRYRKDKEHGNNLFLTINGQDLSCHKVSDTQERINQLLKVNFDVLKSTIILTSDMKSNFADLTPKDRVSILESIRDYTIWEKVRAESNLDIKTLDADIKDKTGQINQMQGSINTFNGLIDGLRVKYIEEKNKVTEENSEEKIKNLQKQLNDTNEQLLSAKSENYDDQITSLESEIDKKRQELDEKHNIYTQKVEEINQKYKTENTNIRKQLPEINQEIKDLSALVMNIDFDIKTLRSDVDTIQKWFINDVCPTCNRKLDRTSYQIQLKNNEKEELLKKIKQKEDEKAKTSTKLFSVESKKIKYEENIENNEKLIEKELHELYYGNENNKDSNGGYYTIEKTFEKDIEKAKEDIEKLKNKQKESKIKIDSLNGQILQLQTQITVLNEQKNSTDSKLKEIQSQAEQHKKEVEKLECEKIKIQAEINKLEKKKTYAKFFYDSLGPKGSFRGSLLARDIAYINECLKIYIPKFFTGADLHLTTPSIEKSAIDLVFEEDGVIKPVSNLSSGERKRVNISIQLAIYDLLQSTSLFNFNLCVFDEIESALDPEGVRQLLEVIDDRQDNFQTAWWITNNEMVSSNILNKIVAKKQNGFTKVEYM